MRLVQVSDSHLALDKPARVSELEKFIDAINGLSEQPDVVVHTGDVAHNGSPEEYAVARQIMNRLHAPYYVLAGNRDHRGNLVAAFGDRCGLPPDSRFVQYSVDHLAIRLIVVDTLDTESNKGQFCEDRQEQLRMMLGAEPLRPTVVFMHHPPIEVPVGPDLLHFADQGEAQSLLDEFRNRRNILALLMGHVHRGYNTEIGHIQANILSGLAPDLRWDDPNRPHSDGPVFQIYDLPHAVFGEIPG